MKEWNVSSVPASPGIRQIQVFGDEHTEAVLTEEQVISARHDATLPGWLPTTKLPEQVCVDSAPCREIFRRRQRSHSNQNESL